MVQLLDSTLREGEQTPGVSFSIDQKLEIAQLLDDFGVDIIEAGHPAVSRDIQQAVTQVSKLDLNADILAHSRAMRKDIDEAVQCDVDWIGIFFCVSDKSLKERFRMDQETAIGKITDAIEHAKSHGLKVRYTPEDSFRTEFHNLVSVCKAATEAGADRISLADTVGIMTPARITQFISRLQNDVQVPLHVHCHNDLGLAIANSLSATEAGVKVVDVAVNGLGERTGIASLAETAVALKLLYENSSQWDFSLLPELSEMVARYSRIPIHRQAPIVGDNAFTHNAGLHVSAVLKDPNHYESIPVDMVGRSRKFVLDRMAGRDTINHKLSEWNLQLDEENLTKFHHIVNVYDTGGEAGRNPGIANDVGDGENMGDPKDMENMEAHFYQTALDLANGSSIGVFP